MKYVMLIMDGAADAPEARDNDAGTSTAPQDATPLHSACMPSTDRLARGGRVGLVRTTPEGSPPLPATAMLRLLGESPEGLQTSDAALTATGAGLDLPPASWCMRAALVPTRNESGRESVAEETASLSPDESFTLWRDIRSAWKRAEPELALFYTLEQTPDGQAFLIHRGPSDFTKLVASSPTEALDEPIEGHLPGGAPGTASLSLRRLITIACDTLGAHPINVARKEQGLSQASRLWIWDAGKPARSRTITDRFGIKGPGALIATDPAMIGAGVAVGLRNLNLAQGIPNNFMEDSVLGEAAVDALASHDLVVCHARSPALCALGGNWEAKIASLEAIDRFIVGPIASRLPDFGDPTQDPDARGWRLLVTPGRLVSCASRRAEDDPVPFLIAGAWIRSVVPRPFTEIAAESSDLVIERGTDLMEFFLLGGLARTRAIGKPRIEPRSGLLWGPGTDT